MTVEERLLMAYDAAFSMAASALDCRDMLTGEGLALVRLAPMPASRPEKVEDFILHGGQRRVALLANGYPLAELAYSGGDAGRQRALVAFQRAIRPYRPGRDGMLLSNTWGAGNRDSRICQDFLLKEIDAGAKIGVDVIQIDDGWQRGRTANSKKKAVEGVEKVWNGYWAADPRFWTEDRERFPDGLDFLVARAKERGMRFGLWFGPDSSDDCVNWKRDAECLLDYHSRLGIDYFKMDSLKLLTPLALERNRMMFDMMQRESGGDMVFDLDCTAEIRPGFLGLLDVGPMFVENRYTLRPVYWPHHTLKNLWDLSHLIDPVRLRMEFNNPDTNHDKYGGSPLCHGNYRPDALFATVMAASPLAWMELSDVSDKSVAALAPLVRTWKAERTRWHGGVIHPVGSRPDGVEWTGFVSEAADGRGGYALLFRELNKSESYTLDLAPIFGSRPLAVDSVIGGRGKARLDGSSLSVTIPETLDFVWVKLSSPSAPLMPLGDAEVGFRMHLGAMRVAGMDITNDEMASLSVVTNGDVVTGTWKGHPIFGDDFAAIATFERKGESWEYSFRWEGLDSWKFNVESVSFPDLVVPRTRKSGILYSRNHGMGMIRRPDWTKCDSTPVVSSPMREFQFIALLDDEIGGWYVDARDSLARFKNSYSVCRGGGANPRASLGVTAYLPAAKALARQTSGELPWKGTICKFKGGWWNAAQIYRSWALEQRWAKAAAERSKKPEFQKLRDICFWAWNRGGCDAVARPLEKFAADSGVPCALHWDWWHLYPKDVGYPTYWPPYEGVAKFKDTVAALKKAGCYTMVYVNGMSRDRDDPSWADGGEREAQFEHDGTVWGHHWNKHMLEPHRLTTVCGEGPRFHQMIGGVIGNLREAGLDAVYLDQISCAAATPCWSPYHKHPKGDVVGPLLGYHQFLSGLRAQNPTLQLGSEEVSEAFLEDFDLFISLFGTSYERCGLGTLPEFEAVPVWNAIYHGLSAVFGSYLLIDGIPPWDDDRWPAGRKWKQEDECDWTALFPDQFAVEFARTVAWGNQPTAHALRMEHVTEAKFAESYRFMLDGARFYRENRKYLFDGEMLAPGRLECATKKVDFQRRGIYNAAGEYNTVTQPALPTVFHNVWKAHDGTIAAVLVNWSREEQSYSLVSSAGSASGVIPPMSYRCIPLGVANSAGHFHFKKIAW